MQFDAFPEASLNPDAFPNERYTLPPTDFWCRERASVTEWDLDVAACFEAHLALTWYGLKKIIEPVIKCDKPCACQLERGHDGHCSPHPVKEFLDGLKLPWDRRRVWCNPPYDDLEPWLKKAWDEVYLFDERFPVEASIDGRKVEAYVEVPVITPVIAMLIPGDRNEQPFWQKYVEPFRDGRAPTPALRNDWRFAPGAPVLTTHNLPGRQPFGIPGNPKGIGRAAANFPSVLLLWQ